MASSILGGSLGGGREYVLKIIADVKDAVSGIDKVATQTTSMKDKMIGIGKKVATGLAVGAVIEFGRESLNAAADAEDAGDAITSAFGDASGEIDRFSKTAADRMGLSATAYQQMAAQSGRVLANFGVSNKDAAKATEELSQRAADMGAILGKSAPEVMDVFSKAMMGQTKGLKGLQVAISETEIKAKAMALGQVDAKGKVTDAGKAMAIQQLILEKTGKYAGEYANNSKDLGSQQDQLRAKIDNLKVSIGDYLLPAVTSLLDKLMPFITFLTEHADVFVPIAAGIMGIVVAVKAWNTAQLILNSTLLSNPIFLVAAAIAGLIVALKWAYDNVTWFHDAVQALWEGIQTAFYWIKDHWPLLLAILTGPFGTAVYFIAKYWDEIKAGVSSAWNWIVDKFKLLPGAIGDAIKGLGKILIQPFVDMWNSVSNLPGEIGKKFQGLVNGLSTLFDGIGSVISKPLIAGFNAIKWAWNHTLGGFEFKIPDIFGVPGRGQTVKFPYMADGGIVYRPTLAVIGEAGPEAVIPLNRLRATGDQGSNPNLIMNVYALTANSEVGRLVYNALRDYERTSGNRIFTPAAIPSGF